MAIAHSTQFAALRAQRHHPLHGKPHASREAQAAAEYSLLAGGDRTTNEPAAPSQERTGRVAPRALVLGLIGR